MIIIDLHEPPEIEQYFESNKIFIPTKREMLEVGDYIIRHRGYEIPVERKTSDDYISSLFEKSSRLNNQLYNLSKNYYHSFLLITGSFSVHLYNGSIKRKTLISSKLNIICKYSWMPEDPFHSKRKAGRVDLIELDSDYDIPLFLSLLHEKVEKGDFYRFPSPATDLKQTPEECLLLCYQCFPRCGIETAKKLLSSFPTFPQIFNSTPADIKSVKGIGERTSQEIHNFLHYGERNE